MGFFRNIFAPFYRQKLVANAEPNAKVSATSTAASGVGIKDQVLVRKRCAAGRRDDNLTEEERERCLRLQTILQGVPDETIKDILKVGRPLVYQKDDLLILQGDPAGSIFFILSGAVDVLVNGTQIAVRKAEEVVGEMGVLDPGQKRSASIVARELTRVLRVSRRDFGSIVAKEQGQSQLLFNIARTISARLRDRGESVRVPNVRPVVFIGSSSEAKDVVDAIVRGLKESIGQIEVVSWSDSNVFQPSASTMESLEKIAQRCDFAIMVFSPDDKIWCRGRQLYAPRDNVVFELGLFMGNLGRLRCFYLVKDAKIPSDIIGDTRLTYKKSSWSNRIDAKDAIFKMALQIKKQGVRK